MFYNFILKRYIFNQNNQCLISKPHQDPRTWQEIAGGGCAQTFLVYVCLPPLKNHPFQVVSKLKNTLSECQTVNGNHFRYQFI